MIASVRKEPIILIKEHQVDADAGKVTLFMHNVNETIATSVKLEIEQISASRPNTKISFQYDKGFAKIDIDNADDIAKLALTAAKIMTRRLQVFDGANEERIRYASLEDTKLVLNILKAHAQKTSANAVIAIDALISSAEEIERI